MSTEGESEEKVDTRMRIPKGLYERVKALALRERRSINAQVIVLLELAMRTKERESGEGNNRRILAAA